MADILLINQCIDFGRDIIMRSKSGKLWNLNIFPESSCFYCMLSMEAANDKM